ncbi:MAG: hypothetical protein DRI01_08090 [Chloroflexi bacterium]|nr:MAG: hypothetical protein DRI01_08090 [Chloroflexota bacterium]
MITETAQEYILEAAQQMDESVELLSRVASELNQKTIRRQKKNGKIDPFALKCDGNGRLQILLDILKD